MFKNPPLLGGGFGLQNNHFLIDCKIYGYKN